MSAQQPGHGDGIPGRYLDGRISRVHEVTFSLVEGEGVAIHGLAEPTLYSLDQVRVTPRLGSTTRALAFRDGARLETEDNDAVDRILPRLGQSPPSGFIHRLESSWYWAAGSLVTLAAITGAAFTWGIPALAEGAAHAVPAELAYDLGQGTLATLDSVLFLESQLEYERKVAISDAFAEMAAGYPDLPLDLEFRSGVPANAFALADGTIVVTDALVELADDDAQVMAVLAHEVGHVYHRHALRMALESAGAALAISTLLGDVSSLTSLSAALPAISIEASYSRAHEWEADTFALAHLLAHGEDPRHFADVMRKLQTVYGDEEQGESVDDANALQYLASHPPTPDRIRRFEESRLTAGAERARRAQPRP